MDTVAAKSSTSRMQALSSCSIKHSSPPQKTDTAFSSSANEETRKTEPLPSPRAPRSSCKDGRRGGRARRTSRPAKEASDLRAGRQLPLPVSCVPTEEKKDPEQSVPHKAAKRRRRARLVKALAWVRAIKLRAVRKKLYRPPWLCDRLKRKASPSVPSDSSCVRRYIVLGFVLAVCVCAISAGIALLQAPSYQLVFGILGLLASTGATPLRNCVFDHDFEVC